MDNKAYRKLVAWQKSMDLVEQVYKLMENLPETEKYGLKSQMQRAAVSIPANIAEGYGRHHRGDYIRHLSFARGSLMELETHLTISVRLEMVERDEAIPLWNTAQEVGRLLTSTIRSLANKTDH